MSIIVHGQTACQREVRFKPKIISLWHPYPSCTSTHAGRLGSWTESFWESWNPDVTSHLNHSSHWLHRVEKGGSSASTLPAKAAVIYFLKTFYFVLGYNRWTMLWKSQVHSEGTQPYVQMYLLSPELPPPRVPHNTEQSSLCYTVGLWWLSIWNTAVCTCPS